MTTLQGPRIRLRPVTATDLPALLAMVRQAAVAQFWSAPDDDADRSLLMGEGSGDGEAITTFAITAGEELVGWIAGWEKLDLEYRHAGVDLFVGSAHHGRGYGREAIQLVCRWLFDERGHHRITIDPAAHNARAIHVYQKVGFQRVGVLRRYERSGDGTYHDGLLLDLLPEDLKL
jgi:aminoglycoside 6'-N-acetyltransferase